MKLKFILFALLFAGSVSLSFAQGGNGLPSPPSGGSSGDGGGTGDMGSGSGTMIGSGGNTPQAMMISTTLPINTSVGENKKINVNFTANIGQITVKVENQSGGTVYGRMLDTQNTTTLKINIAPLRKGSYVLSFADDKGEVIKSEKFEIK